MELDPGGPRRDRDRRARVQRRRRARARRASTSPRAGARGHSDGDVIAHALIDAVLGAAGLGDIGELFPSGDPQWRDASSIRLLQRAYEVVKSAGFELVNADCVLIGEAPRIAPYRDAMRDAAGGAMGVDPAQ